MPPKAVKTVRDLIFWEYALNIIAKSAGMDKQYGFIMNKYKQLKDGTIKWSEILREDLQNDMTKCVYCGSTKDLSNDHIVPKRKCHFNEVHNIVCACKKCNSSKGDKDLFEWYGRDAKNTIPRLVLGKYLKLVYLCHECRETLDKTDIDMDGELNVMDLGAIFKEECKKDR